MIELLEQGAESGFDVEKIDEKTQLRIDRALEVQFDPVGVSVQTVTRMRLLELEGGGAPPRILNACVIFMDG